ERMLQMLKIGGELGIICPSTLFGDVSAKKLRKHLLLRNNVRSIRFFAEKIPLFENVNQATNIFILQKGGTTSDITISEEEDVFDVNISLVKELFPENLEIPTIKSSEWDILRKLSTLKKLKQFPSIRNRRGELDLSLCREFVTSAQTPYRLVRGNMIGESEVKDINGEFVLESFIPTRSKDYRTYDFNRKRLICQQISNGGLRRRLRFIFCASTDVLGNSCNYISSDEETLAKLYLILNSSVLNWRFKITSSNNHINNYELDELPIIDLDKVDASFSYSSQEELDEYIGALYGLSKDERNLIAI
ncbi:N-6 DNA methylase, partial [uncultured Muribaculum sp.]